jgi:hypothetical protein
MVSGILGMESRSATRAEVKRLRAAGFTARSWRLNGWWYIGWIEPASPVEQSQSEQAGTPGEARP